MVPVRVKREKERERERKRVASSTGESRLRGVEEREDEDTDGVGKAGHALSPFRMARWKRERYNGVATSPMSPLSLFPRPSHFPVGSYAKCSLLSLAPSICTPIHASIVKWNVRKS